jgi:HAD superfamily hydrolase (TIGR01484 family)
MNRKLIFTDLDGTLLTRDKKIKDESVRIIKALTAQGHYFCFMTGRAMSDAKPYYDQLGLDTLCICNNGAAIHNPRDEDFRDIFFPMNKQIMLKLSESKEIMKSVQHFVIKTRHYTFVNKVPKEKHLVENFKT